MEEVEGNLAMVGNDTCSKVANSRVLILQKNTIFAIFAKKASESLDAAALHENSLSHFPMTLQTVMFLQD